MTTPLSTGRTTRDIPSVHAAIAPVGVLTGARRALYQLAWELLGPGAGAAVELGTDVLDNPVARGRLGAALGTGEPVAADELPPLGAVVGEGGRIPAGPVELAVASSAGAGELLAGALSAVGAELARLGQDGGGPRLLTEASGAAFPAALGLVREGVALARSTSPELLDDLLPHIGLLGIIDPAGAGRLGSASTRHYPGLVLIPAPGSASEVAEALVHEGAHQKFFDLAITGRMLTAESDRCPPFEVCWPPAGRCWPMEQTLAAAHAYACLARFAADAGSAGGLHAFGPDSLLPVAAERGRLLGDWLLDRGEWLGVDAHTLLAGLHGRRPAGGPCQAAPPTQALDAGWTVRRYGSGAGGAGRAVAGRRPVAGPPELYFVNAGG